MLKIYIFFYFIFCRWRCEKFGEIKQMQTIHFIIWFPRNASTFVSIVVCFSVNYQQSESPLMKVVFVIQNRDEKKQRKQFLLVNEEQTWISSKWIPIFGNGRSSRFADAVLDLTKWIVRIVTNSVTKMLCSKFISVNFL